MFYSKIMVLVIKNVAELATYEMQNKVLDFSFPPVWVKQPHKS